MRWALGCLAALAIGATPAAAVDCGDVLVGPATYVLDADLACATGPALTLRDQAVLRMQQHVVHLDAVTASPAVVIEGTGVRLLDGTILSDSVTGALLDVDGMAHQIRNVRALGHAAGDAVGIRTAPSSRRILIARSAAEFTWDGLSPLGTAFDLAGEEHTIVRNRASRAFRGFRLDGAGHRARRNEAIGTVVGVEVHGAAHLVARTLATLGGDGIIVFGDGHRVLRNRVESNVIGILAAGAHTLFRRNVALGNFPDLRDDTPDCGTDVWIQNRFETAESFGDCIE